MDILTDYANWKLEKYDLVTTLKELDSNIIKRYNNVIAVLDYLYSKEKKKKQTLSADEEVIFNTGFEYLDNNFITIEEVLNKYFNNNIKEAESCSKTINLILYTLDLEDEFLNYVDDKDKNIKDDLKQFEDFLDEIYNYLENKKEVEDALFVKLDEMTIKIFNKHHIDVNPIDSIFYDIAETYGLLDDDSFDINDYLNDKIEHDKTCEH